MNINIETIIASKASNIQTKLSAGYKLGGNETLTLSQAKAAIKEIVEAVIEKCWQKSRIEVRGIHNREINFEAEDVNTLTLKDEAVFVDVKESSILKVKEMISY